MGVAFNPADWPLDMSGCANWSTVPVGVKSNILTAASHAIWSITGRRWGVAQRAIRPRTECGCRSYCSHRCGQIDSIQLTHYAIPIIRVEDVLVGRVAAREGVDYWIGNGVLYPIVEGLLDPWPQQDLAKPNDDPEWSWRIVLTYGEPPPAMALIAAADLACTMARRYQNQACEVPENALSVSRDGVTIRLAQGLVAIPSIRALLDAYPKRTGTRRLIDPAKFRSGVRYELDDYRFEEPACVGSWVERNGMWVWSEAVGEQGRPLTVRVGSVESFEFNFTQRIAGVATPINISSRTYQADIRDPEGDVVESFTCTVLDGPGGVLVLDLSAAQTGSLTAGTGYWWDLRETNGAETTVLFPQSRLYAVGA